MRYGEFFAMSQFTEPRSTTFPTGPIRCLVIESEASIRWSLSFLLQNSGVWQIVGECDRLELGLARLEAMSSTAEPVQVLLLGVGAETPDRLSPILEAVRSVIPVLPIVVLGTLPASAKMIERLAIAGYWWKGDRPEALLDILSNLNSNLNLNLNSGQPLSRVSKPSRIVVSPDLAALARLSQTAQGNRTWLAVDPRFALFDRTLAELNWQLRSQDLSWIDRSVIEGRIRELQTARWIAQKFLLKQQNQQPNQQLNQQPNQQPNRPLENSFPDSASDPDNPDNSLALPNSSPAESDALTESDFYQKSGPNLKIINPEINSIERFASATPQVSRPLTTRLFDQFTIKLAALHKPQDGSPSKLENQTPNALEIDILTPDRRHQLLTLTAQVLKTELQNLQGQQIRLSQLYDREAGFLETLWETVTTQFFLTPVAEPIAGRPGLEVQRFNLTPTLLKSRSIVSNAILKRIPLTGELLAYLLFQTPLTLDNRPYAAGTPEAENRALILLENTTLQLANAVLQPLINQFSEVESVKVRFFNPRYRSSRNLTKFRNDLSWRYRRDRWIDTPTDIFESQYRLFYLTIRGIQTTSIYAPRQAELQTLAGFPLVLTLALETRDAFSPRLRSALSLIGTGVVYVLTEVVGRGIGLIGRGIVKGIGSAWQERR
jgi:DNA-binding NarL/FixJ family response regulator